MPQNSNREFRFEYLYNPVTFNIGRKKYQTIVFILLKIYVFVFIQRGTSKKEHVKRAHENMRPTDLAAARQYDKVVSVITKDPDDRTDTDIQQIKSWFKKKSDLFNQLNDGKFCFIPFYISVYCTCIIFL